MLKTFYITENRRLISYSKSGFYRTIGVLFTLFSLALELYLSLGSLKPDFYLELIASFIKDGLRLDIFPVTRFFITIGNLATRNFVVLLIYLNLRDTTLAA